MKTLILVTTAILTLTVAHGQTESLNKLDSNGKKDGRWTVYVNAKGKWAKDSSTAVYYLYAYYDHGANIDLGTSLFGGINKFESTTESKSNGKLKLLDGEYKGLDKNGKLKLIYIFKNGEFVSYKDFYPTGKIRQYFNYTNRHFERGEFEPHTYCMYIYDKNGGVKYYFMRKGKNGWMGYASLYDSVEVNKYKVIGDSTFARVNEYANGMLIRTIGQIFVQSQASKEITHGLYYSWYPNGLKKTEGDYYYGKKTGNWKHWDKDGKEIKDKDPL